MTYYASQSSSWLPRDGSQPSYRRIRFNAATGYHEAIGGGTPPRAYPTREAAIASVDPRRPQP